MAEDKEITRMTNAQFFKLCEELRNKEEWFKQNRPSLRKGAEYLSSVLSFNVTDKKLAEAKELTGVSWEPPASANGTQARIRYQEQINNLNERVSKQSEFIHKLLDDNQKLHSRLDVLYGLVHELYHQSGAKYPPGYIAPPVRAK